MVLHSKFSYGSQFSAKKERLEIWFLVLEKLLKGLAESKHCNSVLHPLLNVAEVYLYCDPSLCLFHI